MREYASTNPTNTGSATATENRGEALVEQRKKAAKDLEARPAKPGPAAPPRLQPRVGKPKTCAGNWFFIHALTQSDDEEAAAVLQSLISGEDSFSLQHEMLLALSQRNDDAATEALDEVLATSDNQQLRFLAVTGLRGREGAWPALDDSLQTETCQDAQFGVCSGHRRH